MGRSWERLCRRGGIGSPRRATCPTAPPLDSLPYYAHRVEIVREPAMRRLHFDCLDVRPRLDTAHPINNAVALRVDKRFRHPRRRLRQVHAAYGGKLALTSPSRFMHAAGQRRDRAHVGIRMLQRLLYRGAEKDHLLDAIRKAPRQFTCVNAAETMSDNDQLVLRLIAEVTQNAAQPIDRVARAVHIRKDS